MVAVTKLLFERVRLQLAVIFHEFARISAFVPGDRLKLVGFGFFRGKGDVGEAPGSVIHKRKRKIVTDVRSRFTAEGYTKMYSH
jgi:hypothetical protein